MSQPVAQPVSAWVALGSNLGDRAAHIDAALAALSALPACRLGAVSSIIQTAPAGPVPQGPYLNAAAQLLTMLPPRLLLDHLLEIERQQGRERNAQERWGPRTLDLDLLLHGDSVIQQEGLVIPHPRLHERLFVLVPLAQIAGDVLVPTLGKSVMQLRDELLQSSPLAMEGSTC